MVFVDTSAWFAAIVPSDPNHASAAHWLAANADVLITTDYIVDETLTLLRARGERQRTKLLGKKFFEGSIAEIYFLTEEDVREAWTTFAQYEDKSWSFYRLFQQSCHGSNEDCAGVRFRPALSSIRNRERSALEVEDSQHHSEYEDATFARSDPRVVTDRSCSATHAAADWDCPVSR